MTPAIRISDATWERLKRFAVPLEDTPDDAVRRVLAIAEAQRRNHSTPHQPIRIRASDTLQTPSAAGEHLTNPQPNTTRINRTVGERRVPQGERTPYVAYELPILEILYEFGGRGQTRDVLEGIERRMRTLFDQVDYQPMSSGEVRWRNTTRWARHTLVKRGLLKRDSRRGIWELTERGRAEVEKEVEQR